MNKTKITKWIEGLPWPLPILIYLGILVVAGLALLICGVAFWACLTTGCFYLTVICMRDLWGMNIKDLSDNTMYELIATWGILTIYPTIRVLFGEYRRR